MLIIAIVIGLQAVGVILMSAMVVAPAAAARQWTNRLGLMLVLAAIFGALSGVGGVLTDRLPVMLGLSVLIGVVGAISGYWLARFLDTTIAGAMVTMIGLIFGLALLGAPRRGLMALARRRARQKWEFSQTMLAIHLPVDIPSSSISWTRWQLTSRPGSISSKGGFSKRH